VSGLGSPGPGRTPQSSRAGGQPTLTPRVARRIAALGVIAVGLIAVLVVRLWFMQVIGGEAYAERAEVNRLRTVVVEPERGMITDREGKVLVGNSPATNVVARPRELTGARRERVLRRLAPLLEVPYAELDATVAEGENTPFQSVTIASGIDPKLAIALQERPRQFPGISLQQSYVRDYRQTPDGQPHAAHVVGYTGAITEDRIESYRERGYLGDERVGITGIESSYETFLRGTPGEVRVEVDAAGQPVGRGVVSSVAPNPGSNVETSIDPGTQRALEDALRTRTKLNGLAEGAAGVALDPRTGEVLAIASFPGFDPGAFTEGRPKYIARLYRDRLRPLFDRTTQGSYPAASTFKAITGAAALQERVVTPDTALDSPGVIELYDQEFQNYGQQWHGNITMPVALEVSSDTFFYQVADDFFRRADSPLQDWSTKFGLGAPTGIDLPQGAEAPGVVPTPAWKRQTFSGPEFGEIDRIWKPGDTIQLRQRRGAGHADARSPGGQPERPRGAQPAGRSRAARRRAVGVDGRDPAGGALPGDERRRRYRDGGVRRSSGRRQGCREDRNRGGPAQAGPLLVRRLRAGRGPRDRRRGRDRACRDRRERRGPGGLPGDHRPPRRRRRALR